MRICLSNGAEDSMCLQCLLQILPNPTDTSSLPSPHLTALETNSYQGNCLQNIVTSFEISIVLVCFNMYIGRLLVMMNSFHSATNLLCRSTDPFQGWSKRKCDRLSRLMWLLVRYDTVTSHWWDNCMYVFNSFLQSRMPQPVTAVTPISRPFPIASTVSSRYPGQLEATISDLPPAAPVDCECFTNRFPQNYSTNLF